MDPRAYEKVKNHIAQMIRMYYPPKEPPPPPTNTREWAQERRKAKQLEIEEMQRLTFEPRTWSAEEQDILAEVAASNKEALRTRQYAMSLMVTCKTTRHADLLARMMEGVGTGFEIRYGAVITLGSLGSKEMLPRIHRIAMLAKVPPEKYTASLYDACVQAIFCIVAKSNLVDQEKYSIQQIGLYGTLNEMCRRWWEEVQPSEQMILAWSRGEQHP